MLMCPSAELILNLRSTRLRPSTCSPGSWRHAPPWVANISAQVSMQLAASLNGCGCWVYSSTSCNPRTFEKR
eukprot:7434134-Pyramimonas_sp.AAC.2